MLLTLLISPHLYRLNLNMMQPRSILKPATFKFVAFSMLLAIFLRILPWGGITFSYQSIMPDILMIVLSFWALREPSKISVGIGFFCGLIMDIHLGGTLGQFALIYSLVAFAANLFHRKSSYFGLFIQSLHFVPIFFLAKFILYLFAYQKNMFIPEYYWLTPLFEVLLWPVIGFCLTIPQRMNDQTDYIRPI
jgi:rod shape-determining protein MreD